MEENTQHRRGYLVEDFRLFHLRDPQMRPVDFHYHSFHKIMILLSGHVTYAIEGASYALEPGDMVLIGSGSLHRPVVSDKVPYERIILYISPEFLRRQSSPDCDLESCFRQPQEDLSHVLRPAGQLDLFIGILNRLEAALSAPCFGQSLLCRSLFLEFLISIHQELAQHPLRYITGSRLDEKIAGILRYLNLHLTDSISIDHLAEQFCISKYYLMRRFKTDTGYTIHNYLTEKRLILAKERIAAGMSLVKVAECCGFGDYPAFYRAYKKRFGASPTAAPAHPGEADSVLPLE